IWDSVKSLAGLPNVIGSISIIVDLLIPFAKRRSARSVVAKLVVAACSYYIWQERNLRLFMNQKRSHSQVTDCIKSSIRLKLLSCTFKKSKDALLFKRLWNLPDSIFRTLWHVTCVLVVVQAVLEVNVDTANSEEKKETKAMVFHQMEIEEVSDRFMAPCFVNRLEAYDGEINLGVEENTISNEYAFIINPEEDGVEPGCMHTRSQSRNLHHQQQQAPPAFVEPFNLEEPIENPAPPVVPMADNRTMAQLLQAPTEGYEDAIVIPEINANFELKHGLINLVQNKQFFGHDKEDPHAHIRYFNKITSTMRFPDIPSTSIKLMLFPFSLEGSARIWLEKEPPRSILTWDDLVSKFINQFFPPSKTTNLRNEITRFQQRFDESFYEAWDRFNDLLRACPHHGFSELHQLDTFYNALNVNDQDSLNSAAGGNFLDKMPRECLRIIESKSKKFSELNNMMKTLIVERKEAKLPHLTTLRVVSKAAAATFNQAIHILTSDGCQSKSVPPVEITSTMDQVYQTRTSHHKFTKAQPYQAPAQQVQGVSKTDFEKLCQVLPLEVALLTKDPRFLITSTLSNECETEVKWTRCLLLIMEWHEAIQPQSPVVHHESISEPVNAPVSASMPNQKTSIPFPSRRNDERRREKANDQIEKFY
ncbi:reverse transcriptase domain-containing protein, partial [Tanacetum coccineum]